ncbi:DotG/IcmE/VirB10 family protein [Facilibium subflavum]|uniref:DotG/IcmE/VirB10 family protein n=1 Tax=Facilibium subflavum TaxID=2219058 RepID=UPI0013C2C18D|nr:DotG/IcmE/VirB10 family protein [Facilibium subflavum]
MLFSCTKKSNTYLDSSVSTNDIDQGSKTDITDPRYKTLEKKAKQKKIKQAEKSDQSYVDDVFDGEKPKAPQVKKQSIQSENYQHQQKDPVAFYHEEVNPDNQAKEQGGENQTAVVSQVSYKSAENNFQAIVKAWSHAPSMEKAEAVGLASDSNGNARKGDAKVLFKAGDILFGVIDTALNSDQPSTPVLASIVTGPYRGAKLLGSFTREDEKLVIKFNTLALKDKSQSISINAFAVNQKTAQTALATDVDHHYLLRYGSLFAASFLQGFGTYFSDNQYQCPAGAYICINTQKGDLKPLSEAAYSGLGQIGSALSSNMASQFNRAPTVTLDQGSPIGVLIMQDVKV